MTTLTPTPTALSSTVTLYLLANNASTRLTTEAHRPDLHLRRMVGHANMLDRLTTEIAARENALYVVDVQIPKPKAKPDAKPLLHRLAAFIFHGTYHAEQPQQQQRPQRPRAASRRKTSSGLSATSTRASTNDGAKITPMSSRGSASSGGRLRH